MVTRFFQDRALSPILFWGEGSPTKIDYRKKGTLLLTSLLEDLGKLFLGDPLIQVEWICVLGGVKGEPPQNGRVFVSPFGFLFQATQTRAFVSQLVKPPRGCSGC